MKKLGFLLLILIFSVGISFAQSDIGLKSIGGKLGFVMPEDPIDNTFGLGVVADLGTITPAIALQAHVEYWGKSYDVGYYEWTFSEIIIGATAKYYFPTQGIMKFYGGGGLDFIIGNSSGEYTGTNPYYTNTDVSDSDTDIGFHFCGGGEYPLSETMTGFAELKYTVDGADFFSIFAGVKFKMGQ